MKKYLKAVICFIVAISVLSAISCGQTETSEKKEEEIPVDIDIDDGIDQDNAIDVIVQNGKTDYKVVYNPEEGSYISYAMKELVRLIYESTGATLGVYADSAVDYDDNGKYISIGNTAQFRKTGITVDEEELNGDGFIIKTIGKNLYIAAATPRGVIYGACDFAEKMLGVRFISQNITHVPNIDKLSLFATDIKEIPAFRYRNLYSYSMRTNDDLYAHLRYNAPEREIGDMYGGRTDWYTKLINLENDYANLHDMFPSYVEFNVIHNAFYWCNPADWYETHPEFFAVDENGKTIRDSAGTICQLNLTNGITEDGKLDKSMSVSVAKVCLESLKNFILDDPSAKVFFFGHNDWTVYDKSPASLAAAQKYGGNAGILMRFVNVLSDEIGKWLKENGIERDITIATWAYLFTENAPVKEDGKGGYVAVDPSVVPRDNVAIRIAPISLDWYYPVYDEHQLAASEGKEDPDIKNLVKKWTYITENFMIWTYETSFSDYLHYFPSMRQWSDNIKYFRKIGVKYLMMQDNYHGFGSWQAEMHTYVASKLLWNPDLKVQPLIDEFLLYYFGEIGASAVSEMMQMLDDYYALKQNDDDSFNMPIWNFDANVLQDPDPTYKNILLRSESLIRQAIEALSKAASNSKMNPTYQKNLYSALLTPQSMILANYSAFYDYGRTAYAMEFITNAEYVGVISLAESQSLINYKAALGLA